MYTIIYNYVIKITLLITPQCTVCMRARKNRGRVEAAKKDLSVLFLKCITFKKITSQRLTLLDLLPIVTGREVPYLSICSVR